MFNYDLCLSDGGPGWVPWSWGPVLPRRRCSMASGLISANGFQSGSIALWFCIRQQESHMVSSGTTPSTMVSQHPCVRPVWPFDRAHGKLLILRPQWRQGVWKVCSSIHIRSGSEWSGLKGCLIFSIWSVTLAKHIWISKVFYIHRWPRCGDTFFSCFS